VTAEQSGTAPIARHLTEALSLGRLRIDASGSSRHIGRLSLKPKT